MDNQKYAVLIIPMIAERNWQNQQQHEEKLFVISSHIFLDSYGYTEHLLFKSCNQKYK